MAKIMLFGSSSIFGVPQQVVGWLDQYARQEQEFIVGDRKGADSAFHKVLSSVGANNVTIYCMDKANHNLYEFKEKRFITSYDEGTKQVEITSSLEDIEPYIIDGVEKAIDITSNSKWYEFRDRQMIEDCDIAICLWDGDTKATTRIIQLLNIHNKPCYTFTIPV